MARKKWNLGGVLLDVPIYYKVIIANSAMALAVITTLLFFRAAFVGGVVVIAAGITNSLLVRAAFQVESQRRSQRQLLAWTLNQYEKERTRVAHQLLNDAAQRMAALILKSSGQPAIADEAAAVMEELCFTARTLQPPGLQLLGLKGALSWYARSLEQRLGVQVGLAVAKSLETLDQSLALGIFRILEDVLESTAQRGPGRVELRASRTDGRVAVTVEVGHALTTTERFRLAERAAVLGGDMRITNRNDQAIVRITIPIGEDHDRHDSRLAG